MSSSSLSRARWTIVDTSEILTVAKYWIYNRNNPVEKYRIVIVIVIVGLNVSGRTLFRHYEVYLVPYTLSPPPTRQWSYTPVFG